MVTSELTIVIPDFWVGFITAILCVILFFVIVIIINVMGERGDSTED